MGSLMGVRMGLLSKHATDILGALLPFPEGLE
jgi:hypothetical protein